ncbi:apolipoprotein D-like [Cydia splendana]|uniref:apolipoprotein D-like n=1 Tax=Cydia splendana TaxID=1100963 RepID=UPI00212AB139
MGDFRVRGLFNMLMTSLTVGVMGTRLGTCPVYPQQPNFQIQKMTGTWYEVERSFYLMEMTASCTELHVTLNERGYYLIAVTTVNRWTGSPATTYGVGIPNHNGSSSFRYKLNNRMPYIIGRMLPGAGQYSILFTDYDHFAVVWSCTSVSIMHNDRFWILGRRRELSAELRANIYALLQELRLDPDRLLLSKNSNCVDSPDQILK